MFQTVAGRLGAGCSFSRLTPWPRSGQHDAPRAIVKLLIYLHVFCSTDTFPYSNPIHQQDLCRLRKYASGDNSSDSIDEAMAASIQECC